MTKNMVAAEVVGKQSTVTRMQASYPLRFFFVQRDHGVVWVYTVNFGGGLVSGDVIEFSVSVGPGASMVLTTQSSTKVFKAKGATSKNSVQEMHANVEDGGLLCIAPDPVTCFRNSKYRQIQTIKLSTKANLIYVDWLTCGRQNGLQELWDMEYYENNTSVFLEGTPVFLEDIVLEQGNSKTEIRSKMGYMNVIATVVFVGPIVLSHERLSKQLPSTESAGQTMTVLSDLFDKAGKVVRIAGPDVETVEKELEKLFEGLDDLLGDCLFKPQRVI